MIEYAQITKTAAFHPTGHRTTEILVGQQVLMLLDDTRFLNEWDQLCNACTWATIFQSSSFVATWYRVYMGAYLPIMIRSIKAGKLVGLLTLAEDKNGLICGAGASQAEYQVWLADSNDEAFIKTALLEVHRLFPKKMIRLQYLPTDISLGFTKDPILHKCCFVKASPHSLMIIDEHRRSKELRKKNRREKINRLNRLGELKFEKISDYATFAAIIDELALQSDFRKGAMYNKMVFKTDPLRKKFLQAQFQQNNLHVTVLKLNNTIIASNVSLKGDNRLYLQGINSFDVTFARYSPGIIHFLLLGKLLAEEGVGIFDLTPGEDAYKETLATDCTVAYALSIGNNYHGFTHRLKSGLNSYMKKTAPKVGIKIKTLKKLKKSFNHHKQKLVHAAKQGRGSLVTYFLHKVKWRRKTAICQVIQKDKTSIGGLLNIQKDNLKDLLDFDQRDIRYSHQEFLADAMKRFEEGAHSYTWAENEVLLGCAWVAEPVDWSMDDEDAISLSGLYCHPKAHKLFPDFLKSIAALTAAK